MSVPTPMNKIGEPSSAPVRKLNGIQWLRALAAIIVVAFHASGRWNYNFGIGQYGVDIFFVISGFIMWGVASSPISPIDFLRDRIARIVPIYWLATAVLTLGGALGLFPKLSASIVQILCSLLFIPYPDGRGIIWPTLSQGWTLNYEMFFYVVFSAILMLPKYFRSAALLVSFSILAAIGVVWNSNIAAITFYTRPIILEFALGVLIGQYFTRNTLDRKLGILFVAAGLLCFVLGGLGMIHGPQVLVFGIPATLLISGFIALEQSGTRFDFRPLVFLGDASYSIYLFHTFAISVAVRFLPRGLGVADPIVGTLLGVTVGCVAYWLVERPLVGRLRRKKRVPDAVEVAQVVLGGPRVA
jgi:exopolysaccharide production protein ExoZ